MTLWLSKNKGGTVFKFSTGFDYQSNLFVRLKRALCNNQKLLVNNDTCGR